MKKTFDEDNKDYEEKCKTKSENQKKRWEKQNKDKNNYPPCCIIHL